MTRSLLALVLALTVGASASEPSQVLEDFGGAPTLPSTVAPRTAPALSTATPAVRAARAKGVAWVLANQHADGGWSSGAHGSDGVQASSDVATTAFTTLALARDAGGSDRHDVAIARGVDFVLTAVDAAPDGPRLATPVGTQIQYKLGELVDTHLAALMLGELAGSLDRGRNSRMDTALDKVLTKVQSAQRADGSFDGNGWAPVLSTSLAAQSLNQAVALGKVVDEDVISRSDAYQQRMADTSTGAFDASAGAGVELYAVAGSLANNKQITDRTGRYTADAPAAAAAEAVQAAAVGRIAGDDGRLMAGFGSIGGEEMLSYMMISDTLAAEGGSEWASWEERIGTYLVGIQNADGSWVGHHCITSRAFTTAGGLMTLSAGDAARAPAPARG
ncbi:MAG: hypothetical protein ACI8PZ_002608 [Myxococcota bacterium]|jgi:hypothetical protein